MKSALDIVNALKNGRAIAAAPAHDATYIDKLASALEYVAANGTFGVPTPAVQPTFSEKTASAQIASSAIEKALLDKIAQKKVAQDDGLRKTAAAALVSRLAFEKIARQNAASAVAPVPQPSTSDDGEPSFELNNDSQLSPDNIADDARVAEAVKVAAAIPVTNIKDILKTAMATGTEPVAQTVTAASENTQPGVKTASAGGKVGPMAIATARDALRASLMSRTAG